MRKFDMDEPPMLEESIEDVDKCIKQIKDNKGDEIQLEEKYYKYICYFNNSLLNLYKSHK